MGKSKDKSDGIPNKHIHQRASFLYQAAAYLDKASQSSAYLEHGSSESTHKTKPSKLGSGTSRLMISHMKGVTLKSTLRLSTSIKHATCKRCENVLNEGTTLKTYVENKSREGKKPWADVLVHECTQCGFIRRFPVGAKRQARRQTRLRKNVPISTGTNDAKPSEKVEP